ncbi:hypothetical protein GCM10011418_00730 [Sphingobacterium alkalisoli]|nr:hypothetical protein GCM10011418_00730 [Sphingobacterium alkalisoli]
MQKSKFNFTFARVFKKKFFYLKNNSKTNSKIARIAFDDANIGTKRTLQNNYLKKAAPYFSLY